MNPYFESRAKLLLTGEYLVLAGARALALPLKFIQSLCVLPGKEKNCIHWQSFEYDKLWFEAKIVLPGFNIRETSSSGIANRLVMLLKAAQELNPLFLNGYNSIHIETKIDFNRNWGLGTSSTLLSNIAYWANVNPFDLNSKVSLGSGYDIACARADQSIVYTIINGIVNMENVHFFPSYANYIYFVYLGKKQNSDDSIRNFNPDRIKFSKEIRQISDFTDSFVRTGSFKAARIIMEQHEEIISEIIGKQPVQQQLFPDFRGTIKSLGAWGGDFIMVLSDETEDCVKQYFYDKQLTTIFRFSEICINI